MRAPWLCLTLMILFAAASSAAPPSDFYWLEDDPTVVCDGVADDTLALQAALNTVAANGGTLVFPNGKTCKYTGTLTILFGAHFVLEGNGATLKKGDTNLSTAGLKIEEATDFEIRNLILVGSLVRDPESGEPISPCGGFDLLRLIDIQRAQFINVRTELSQLSGFSLRSQPQTPLERRTRDVTFINHTTVDNCEHGVFIVEGDNIQLLGGRSQNNGGSTVAASGVRLETNTDQAGFDPFRISRVLVQGMTVSGNEGAGIHFGTGSGDGFDLTDIRVVDNVISDNDLGAFRLGGGLFIQIRGNQIGSHSLPTADSVVWINHKVDHLVFDGNQFHDITAPVDVVWVRPPAFGFDSRSVAITGNQFLGIAPSSGASSRYVIHHAGNDAVVSGNQVRNTTSRGITASGANAVVTGNVMRDMTTNAVTLSGTDPVFSDNLIEIATAGSGVSTDAVVYTTSGATNGLFRGNTLLCSGTTQQGFYVSQTLQLFNDNSVKNCASPGWASATGTVGTVMGDNRKY